MSCGCENKSKEKVSILRGKTSLLQLIRSVAGEEESEPVKTETFVSEPVVEEPKTLSDEDMIEAKRLQYILKKIEELRSKNFIEDKKDE